MTSSARTNPGVRFPPPLLQVGGLVAGWLLDRHVVAMPLASRDGAALHSLGIVLVVAGFALTAWGQLTFRAAHTAIYPNRPTTRIVRDGPYRFTRNPMYVGLTIAYLGITAIINSGWPVLLLPVVLILLWTFVIRREEAYLTSAFGNEYRDYCASVRRWV